MCNYKSVCTHTYTVYIYIFVYSVYIKYIALYSTAELCYCFNMFLKDLEDKTCHVLRFDQAKHVTLLCRSHFDLKRGLAGAQLGLGVALSAAVPPLQAQASNLKAMASTLVASLLLVAMRFATSSYLLLVAIAS